LQWACILVACLTFSTSLHAEAPRFISGEPLTSDTGHVLIEWQASGTVTLEMAGAPDLANARSLYEGTNHAFFISGLEEGDYYLRLRAVDAAATEPLLLRVRHQSLRQALWLALLGAFVTLATITAIVRGARDE